MDTIYIVEYRNNDYDGWQVEMIYHSKHDADYYMAQIQANNPGLQWRVKEYKVI